MGLTNWKGTKVRMGDVTISKNYLIQDELEEMNLIVSAFLENAELRARRRQTTTMQEWATFVDNFLTLNEKPILNHAGRVSHERMEQLVGECYDQFDANRRDQERLIAEAEHEREITEALKQIEGQMSKRQPKKRDKDKEGGNG